MMPIIVGLTILVLITVFCYKRKTQRNNTVPAIVETVFIIITTVLFIDSIDIIESLGAFDSRDTRSWDTFYPDYTNITTQRTYLKEYAGVYCTGENCSPVSAWWFYAGGLILLVLLIICVVGYWILKNKNPNSNWKALLRVGCTEFKEPLWFMGYLSLFFKWVFLWLIITFERSYSMIVALMLIALYLLVVWFLMPYAKHERNDEEIAVYFIFFVMLIMAICAQNLPETTSFVVQCITAFINICLLSEYIWRILTNVFCVQQHSIFKDVFKKIGEKRDIVANL